MITCSLTRKLDNLNRDMSATPPPDEAELFHVIVPGIPELRNTYNSLHTAISETKRKLHPFQLAASTITDLIILCPLSHVRLLSPPIPHKPRLGCLSIRLYTTGRVGPNSTQPVLSLNKT